MLKKYSDRFFIRLLSLSVSAIIPAMEAAGGQPVWSISGLCPGFLTAALVVQLSPDSFEHSGINLKLAAVVSMAALVSVSISLLYDANLLAVTVNFASTVILLFCVTSTVCKYCDETYCMAGSIARYGAENSARFVYAAAYLCLCAFLMHVDEAEAGPAARAEIVAITFLQYALLYYKAYTGRTLILSDAGERRLSACVARLDTGLIFQDPEEAVRMDSLYKRILEVMSKEKPFTNPDFSEDDLAGMVHDNRTYVSRAINRGARESFPKFTNRFRVKESVIMMEKDPSLNVADLAIICGFNSKVTYNNAFKEVMGVTPGRYKTDIKALEHLSSYRGQEP